MIKQKKFLTFERTFDRYYRGHIYGLAGNDYLVSRKERVREYGRNFATMIHINVEDFWDGIEKTLVTCYFLVLLT